MDTQPAHPEPLDSALSPGIRSKPRDPPKVRRKAGASKWSRKKVRGAHLEPEDQASLIQNVSAFTQAQRGQKLNHFFRRQRDVDIDPYGFQDLNFWSDRFADALELDASKVPEWPPGSNVDEGDLALDSCLAFWATYSQEQENPAALKRVKRAYRKRDPSQLKGRKQKGHVVTKVETDQDLAVHSTGNATTSDLVTQ